MKSFTSRATPLVSIIIPCYNHGRYLQQAIDSILHQTYENLEVIVVDDGSTDNTREVAMQNKEVKYVYQYNQGLSAARNKGISNATGEFLIFLDADDRLYNEACAINLSYLCQNPNIAFVSGSHDKLYVESGKVQPVEIRVTSRHYVHLLKSNFIGMHATVMYRKWVFDEFLFDTKLKACEDYDLYLRIARKYPVLHHTNRVAVYMLHESNMSNNIPLMLTTALKVLQRQKLHLHGIVETSAYAEGLRNWSLYYIEALVSKLQQEKGLSMQEYYALLRHDPELSFYNLFTSTSTVAIMNRMIKYIPSRKVRNKLSSLLGRKSTPAPGKVRFGDFLRYAPFSTQFGYDRGGPVDRFYIENFLEQEAACIRGSVLEIGDNAYTLLYGGDKIIKSDILHVDDSNPNATLVGDISNAPDIPDNTFDCIVLTQTLHLIYHFKDALRTCHRILKPGGALLLTVPGITPIDHGEWKNTWYWSFTDRAMQRLMEETFPGSDIDVNPFGNVFTSTAFLNGMGLPEVPSEMLKYNDPHFQVIITVKATKAS